MILSASVASSPVKKSQRLGFDVQEDIKSKPPVPAAAILTKPRRE
jgi:hypothetical protein